MLVMVHKNETNVFDMLGIQQEFKRNGITSTRVTFE
jgi:hypothetical protein